MALITHEGFNDLLDEYLIGPQVSKFVGLIDAAGYSSIAVTDTAGGINTSNGWAESSDYAETARQPLIVIPAVAGATDNSGSLAAFTMVGTGTIKGAFTVNFSSKGGTTGRIFNEFIFTSGDISYTPGTVISVKADFTAAICG